MKFKYGTKVVVGTVSGFILLVLLGTAVVSAADSSKPGDFLYSIDLLGESVQRAITFGDDNQAELEMKLLEERKEELKSVEGNGDSDEINDSIEKLEEQEDRVKKQIREMNGSSNVDEEEKEKVTERSEDQVREHEEELEQIQEQLREKDLEREADDVKEVQKKYKERHEGAIDSNDSGYFSEQDEGGKNKDKEKDKNKDKDK